MSAWAVVAVISPLGVTRPRVVAVDRETYAEALTLLGDAWSSGAFLRFRAVASYVATIEPEPLDLRDWMAGRVAWERYCRR